MMSQDDHHDSGMAQQVKDLVQGAIKEQLSPIMEQLAPLSLGSRPSRNQVVVSLVMSPLYGDDESLLSTH